MSPFLTPWSDESGVQLNREAWGKGVQGSPDPSGAVLYLVLKSGRPRPRDAGPQIYLADAAHLCPRTPSAVAGRKAGSK